LLLGIAAFTAAIDEEFQLGTCRLRLKAISTYIQPCPSFLIPTLWLILEKIRKRSVMVLSKTLKAAKKS